MKLQWSSAARRDLMRLHGFLNEVSPSAADHSLDQIFDAVEKLPLFPELGRRLERFESQNVRVLLTGDYEIRYAIEIDGIRIIRLWHTREDR